MHDAVHDSRELCEKPSKIPGLPATPGSCGQASLAVWASARDGLPETLQEIVIFPGRATRFRKCIVLPLPGASVLPSKPDRDRCVVESAHGGRGAHCRWLRRRADDH